MKTYLLPVVMLVLLLAACNNTQKQTNTDNLILGERIDGPANVRDSANGKVLFSLNDGVLVETTPAKNGWQNVSVWVDPIDTLNDGIIYPGGNIIAGGKVIGKAVDTVTVWLVTTSPPEALIEGCTHSKNIAKETVPENVLSDLINSDKLDKVELKQFTADFKFEPYELNKELEMQQMYIYESFIVDPSPRDRITLLFNNSNHLVGVIHSRPLNTPNYKTYQLIRGHMLTITAKMAQADIDRLIEVRNRFLNSVD